MKSKTANESAFPIDYETDDVGLTKLEWFVTHAPKEIPDWFRPSLWPYPKPNKNASYCDGCKNGEDCEETDSCRLMRDYDTLVHKWRRDKEMAILVQWPIFWAEALCAELDKRKEGK